MVAEEGLEPTTYSTGNCRAIHCATRPSDEPLRCGRPGARWPGDAVLGAGLGLSASPAVAGLARVAPPHR